MRPWLKKPKPSQTKTNQNPTQCPPLLPQQNKAKQNCWGVAQVVEPLLSIQEALDPQNKTKRVYIPVVSVEAGVIILGECRGEGENQVCPGGGNVSPEWG
jgi:hypothetical protein